MGELRLWAAAAAGPAVAAAFSALAALRRMRSLHPIGVGYQGSLQVPAQAPAAGGPAMALATVLPAARSGSSVPPRPTGSGSSCEPPRPSAGHDRWRP